MLSDMYEAAEVKYMSFQQQLVDGASGLVVPWSVSATITFSCVFDVSKFPFDSHTCNIQFRSLMAFKTNMYRIGKENLMFYLTLLLVKK